MDIRKISVGPDYKSGAMHYVVGQDVLGAKYKIHLIKHYDDSNSFKVWIEGDLTGEVMLWKEFTSNIPVSVEYNINF